jgi:hypothetical protein
MKNRLPARRIAYERPLTEKLIRKTMSGLFPRRNDYGDGSFEELVAELEALGINCVGDFKRLMTHHRRALLNVDRAPLSRFERKLAIKDHGADFVSDATRRHYWFAYPGLVRTAIEMHFGENAVPSELED